MLELTPDFIRDFAVYLSTVKGNRNATIWLNCMWLKGVVIRAHFNGKIPRNPFAQFHVSPNTKEREFLTEDELKRLMSHEFTDSHSAFVRDLFVFASFTTLSFVDLKELGSFLNFYEPTGHQPRQGEFPHIEALARHIFGEQYELGMDYLQLLYLHPIEKLPFLLLVSEELNTGKSTFLNFLKALFGGNVTFNTYEDFRSQFNSDWVGKLLILVDEVLLDRREESERLKNLSTTLSYKVEAKGKDRDEISFFAKFVLYSNNECLPVIIDAGETRYWVRKVGRIEKDDPDFLQRVKEEIPAFLFFLQHRTLSARKESRM